MNLVSIIVPVYNTEKYLNRCIESLINQTYKNIEIILVDDGSTDTSGKICEEYAKKDSRIKVFHKINEGVSVARNYGISNCSGGLIQFVDSDDYLDTFAVEELLTCVKENNVDTCIFSICFECGKGNNFLQLEDGLFSVEEVLNSPYINATCSPCNKIYNANIIKNNNITFEKGIKFGEDFMFNSKYLQHTNKILVKNKAYYHYNVTTEDSGVKKFYNDYDIYILKMEESLKNLLNKFSVENEKGILFNFIGDRWEYAFNSCCNLPITIKEQSKILIKWIEKIPFEYFEYYQNKKGLFAYFSQYIVKNKNYTQKHIESLLQKYKKSERRKQFILRIKKFLKGIK